MESDVRSQILTVLIDRYPNFVTESTLRSRLVAEPGGNISAVLGELVASGELEVQEDPQKITGTPAKYYRVQARSALPVRRVVRVGDVDVPRLLSDQGARFMPSTSDDQLEALARYSDSLERRFLDLVREDHRRYWANVVTIFAVFTSVLALLLSGLPKIDLSYHDEFWVVVKLSAAQLLPVAFVLGGFIWLVRRALK